MSRAPPPPPPTTSSPPTAQQPYFTQVPLGTRPEELLLAPQPPSQPQIQSQEQASPPNPRKRKAPGAAPTAGMSSIPASGYGNPSGYGTQTQQGGQPADTISPTSAPKKSRTNTPWTPAEEQRLKAMRDAGNSWSEIAKTFPNRTEGSVKKHWYKDMHYADWAEDEKGALLAAIKEYEASKWKVIGQKVGKPAKACEQYAKENFGGRI